MPQLRKGRVQVFCRGCQFDPKSKDKETLYVGFIDASRKVTSNGLHEHLCSSKNSSCLEYYRENNLEPPGRHFDFQSSLTGQLCPLANTPRSNSRIPKEVGRSICRIQTIVEIVEELELFDVHSDFEPLRIESRREQRRFLADLIADTIANDKREEEEEYFGKNLSDGIDALRKFAKFLESSEGKGRDAYHMSDDQRELLIDRIHVLVEIRREFAEKRTTKAHSSIVLAHKLIYDAFARQAQKVRTTVNATSTPPTATTTISTDAETTTRKTKRRKTSHDVWWENDLCRWADLTDSKHLEKRVKERFEKAVDTGKLAMLRDIAGTVKKLEDFIRFLEKERDVGNDETGKLRYNARMVINARKMRAEALCYGDPETDREAESFHEMVYSSFLQELKKTLPDYCWEELVVLYFE